MLSHLFADVVEEEGGGKGGGGGRNRFKTVVKYDKLCIKYRQGHCPKGNNCRNLHKGKLISPPIIPRIPDHERVGGPVGRGRDSVCAAARLGGNVALSRNECPRQLLERL